MKRTFFFLLLVSMWACKETPVPIEVDGTPVFYAEGTIDGSDFSWSAGKEEMYMYTEFSKNEDDVLVYAGYLAKEDCGQNCYPKLRFLFYGESEAQGEVIAEDYLKSREVKYAEPEVLDAYEVTMTPETWTPTSPASLSYSWDFGDGSAANSTGPITHTYLAGDIGYNVCLQSNSGANNCSSNICRDVLWDNPCETDYRVIDYTTYYVVEVINPNPNAQYQWAFSSGRLANGTSVECEIGERHVERVCLTTNSENGCVSTSCKNVVVDPSAANCATNFTHTITPTTVLGAKKLRQSRVELEYTDASGTVYKSNTLLQPSDSYFEIVEVEDYSNASNGQPTKRLELLFNCKLYNADQVLELKDFHASIAVAVDQAP